MVFRFLVFMTMMALARGAAASPEPIFKIFLEEPGVYRLSFEELADAGLEPLELASASIGLSNRGVAVPLWIDDGGDGLFGTGDSIEFVGHRLSANGLYYHEYSRYNVYWLTFDGRSTSRMNHRRSSPAVMVSTPAPLERRIHLERDQLLIRVREDEILSAEDADLWFWAKLTHIDPKPTEVEIDVTGAVSLPGETFDLRIGVRGVSRPHPRQTEGMTHHQVDLTLNGEPIGSGLWDGRQAHTIEILDIDRSLLRDGPNSLELRIPSRPAAVGEDSLVDVAMLNWVEVTYSHSGHVGGDGQVELVRADTDPEAPAAGVVEIRGGDRLRLYSDAGERVEPFVTSGGIPGLDANTTVRFEVTSPEPFFVTDGELRHVNLVELDRPSDLHNVDNRADYLMIAHSRLIGAIQPLAEFHRERGLEVAVVDVEEIYDEFNDGIIHPKAIRDFVAYAYHEWRDPAPRFVLLVGDASWDTKNLEVDDRNYANWVDSQLEDGERFLSRKAPVYAERTAVNHRQLIPTWNFTSHEGHSASDNYFVAIDGDDFFPDLAIGRFPVFDPEEVEAIVAKTIAYVEDPDPGPWHRNVLWITNESAMFQKSSDDLARQLAERGYAATKVYPSSEETSNELHQAALQGAFNDGQLIVHFLGHGGRHIWRTGPPDFRKNHDLFTLDHVAELEPTRRLTFVLSMTCYSAPFDHPNQDSIGEMFLRVPNRGAVGVFAASWRNSPSRAFSGLLLDELTVPGTPVGIAIMHAKQQTQNRTLVETYNLLGDPAITLALPQAQIELEVVPDGSGARVSGHLAAAGLTGEGALEWVDDALEIVHSEPISLTGDTFEVNIDPDAAATVAGAYGVRAWVIDPTTGKDAVGWWGLASENEDGETQRAVPAATAVAEIEAEGAAPIEAGNGKGR